MYFSGQTSFSEFFCIPSFTLTYKNIKMFASGMFKFTISGKLYLEEATHIEGCVNPNTQVK